MSLRGQFFVSVVMALVLGLSALGIIACWHARGSVENEMRRALEAGDRIVDNALLSLPDAAKDAYLSRLVASFDDNRHVRVILMQGGRVLAQSRLAPPEDAPGWFVRLLEIPSERRLDYSPRLEGRMLVVATDPHNEISESWVQFRDGALILSGFSLLVLGLLHLALARATAPLARLSTGFDSVGGGDYAARVVPRGPREFSYLAQAFNRMAERLGMLETANARLAHQMSAIQEEERADLARDLHDEMGPFLFAMRVDAESIAGLAEGEKQGAIAERARAIGEAVSHIQRHVRLILKQLRPEGLSEIGLAQAIANLAAFWQRRHDGIAIHLDIEAAGSGFGAETDAAIYRLVQESITNAARHGGARQVWIAIAADAGAIRVTVEDDGVGLASSGGDGLGLKGMRERLAALAGTVELHDRASGGARLAASVPRVMDMKAAAE